MRVQHYVVFAAGLVIGFVAPLAFGWPIWAGILTGLVVAVAAVGFQFWLAQMPSLRDGIIGLVMLVVGLAWFLVAAYQYRQGGAMAREWLAEKELWYLPYLAALLLGVGGLVSFINWLPLAWHITIKELRTYFTSPIAYAVMMGVFGVFNLLYWLFLLEWQKASSGGGVGPQTLMTLTFLILLVSPLLTMRLLAEEKRSGTFEMLMTRPVHDLQVVLGKFASALIVLVVMLAVTAILPLIVEMGGDPDWGPIWTGYAGLVGVCAAFAAIGLFASALTSSQIAAAAVAWFVLLVMWLIGFLEVFFQGKFVAKVGAYISPNKVMVDFSSGTVDTTQVIYLLTVTVFFLFASWMALYQARSR